MGGYIKGDPFGKKPFLWAYCNLMIDIYIITRIAKKYNSRQNNKCKIISLQFFAPCSFLLPAVFCSPQGREATERECLHYV